MGKETDRDIAVIILSNINAIHTLIQNIELNCFRVQITEQPLAIINAVLGDTVTISLTAINAVSYQWYKKGSSDTTWSKVTGETTSTLSFTASETGNISYRCEVKGKDGFLTVSNSCFVRITSQ